MALNKTHARAIRASFTHVSELLDDLQKLARDDLNPFDRQRPDLSPAEARRLGALAAAIRAGMLDALDTLGVGAAPPDGSARWSARTALLFGDIALSELSGGDLKGYGAMEPEDEFRVASVVEHVRELVTRAQELLRGVDPAAVDGVVGRVQGPLAEALAKIWSFARKSTLVDVYGEIAAVAERASAPVADVGVFGRANSGKSSLINALVGGDVLPVGPLPLTAFPLRLARGPAALHVCREDGPDQALALEELRRFDVASLGPGDEDIVGLEALVPTVPEGLRFLDTPGMSSRSDARGAGVFDWLPRCDLGLLLIPAGSVPGAEDAALARGLLAAGVELKIVLSKADQLAPGDVVAVTTWVRDTFAAQLGACQPEVLPVSATDGEGTLTALRRDVLDPLAAERDRPTQPKRLHARLLHLLGSVETAFEGRASEAPPAEGSKEELAALRETLEGRVGSESR